MKKRTINGKVYVITPEEQERTCFGCALYDHSNEAYMCPYIQPECKEGMIFKALETEETKKPNLKPFNLEEAKAGKPVCTRDGAKARIICFDAKSDAPIIALITTDDGTEIAFDYLSDGTFFNSENPNNDLMMLLEKKEGWVNVYKDGTLGLRAYNTKKEAFDKASPSDYVDTVKISWEE